MDKTKKLEKKYCDLVDLTSTLSLENEKDKNEVEDLNNDNQELVDSTSKLNLQNDNVKDEVEDPNYDNQELVASTSKPTLDNDEDRDKIQCQEKGLCSKFDNSIMYSRINMSPEPVDKSQDCVEWWCPMHSKFATIIKTYKPNSDAADMKIIEKAKARFAFWNQKPEGKICCTNNRKYKKGMEFFPPSNWPKLK